MMRRLILVSSILAGTAVMLTAVYALLFVTVRVARIQTPVIHAGAVVATLVVGVMLLVGATYFSTHLVVRLYRHSPNDSNPRS